MGQKGVGGRGNQDAIDGDYLENVGGSLRMMFWNVCMWLG